MQNQMLRQRIQNRLTRLGLAARLGSAARLGLSARLGSQARLSSAGSVGSLGSAAQLGTTSSQARLEALAPRTRQLAQRARRLGTSTAGLSLVEVLVASAIIAIVSLLLVVAFYTMGSVSMRAADITNSDEQLTSDIALTPQDSGEGKDGYIILKDEDGTEIKIPLTSNEYTTGSGDSLWIFGYRDE